MRDDPDFNIDLVQEIEKFPSLYDPTHVDYTKRNVQDRVWRELAEKMGEPVDAIKSRWKNLRSRHFKVKNHSIHSTGAVKRKSYYLAEYLQFLDKVGELRPFEEAVYDVHDVLKVEVDEAMDQDPRRAVDRPEVAMYRENSQVSQNTAPESETSEDDVVLVRQDKNAKRKRIQELNNGSTHSSDLHARAHALSINAQAQSSSAQAQNVNALRAESNVVSLVDPDLAFMYSLVPDVRNMKDEVKRKFKIKLLQLIDETLSNQ
uniref:Transcription factor Adf-1 n=1 Tax=Lygus hesperus TaxID=30085 RepID=A0A0K8SJS8_LYGHE